MTYRDYIAYHLRGDAGVEERMIAALCRHFRLSRWEAFQLIYFYTMTYNIPSALAMLLDGERDKKRLAFRTDRRYVRCHGAFDRLLAELTQGKLLDLQSCNTTQEAYNIVSGWYYFGRYAAFLFLEVYMNAFQPKWKDDIQFGWEASENYTKGAVEVCGSADRAALDAFLDSARRDTADNAFAIETSLCAVAKFRKGTRWDGFYTERMLQEADKSSYKSAIYACL